MYKPGTEDDECCKKVANGRKVGGVIRSLTNVRSLQLEHGRVLYKAMLTTILLYGDENDTGREGKV